VDPLAEKYHTFSPYGYVANNPAIAYDGDGRKIIYVNGFFSRLLNLGGFAAGMASYLILRGQKVENMLYLSPDEVDDKFSTPIGTFSIQSHFQGDGISLSKRLEGVDVVMIG